MYKILWDFLKVKEKCKTNFFPIPPKKYLIYILLPQNLRVFLQWRALGDGLSGLGRP